MVLCHTGALVIRSHWIGAEKDVAMGITMEVEQHHHGSGKTHLFGVRMAWLSCQTHAIMPSTSMRSQPVIGGPTCSTSNIA